MPFCRLLLQLGVFLDYYTGNHEPSISVGWRDALKNLPSEDSPALDKEEMLRDLIPVEHGCLFPQLLIDPTFPPTFLLHGERDTAVHLRESVNLKRLLDIHQVRNVLRVVEGEEHSFDYADGASKKYETTFDEVFDFLQSCI